MDVRKILALPADEGVVLNGVFLALAEEQHAANEVVRLCVVHTADAGHAVGDLKGRLPAARNNVLPLGHGLLRIRLREVAALCHEHRKIIRREGHVPDLLLDGRPQRGEGRIGQRGIGLRELRHVVPLVLILNPAVEHEGAIHGVVLPEDLLVLLLLIVQDAAADQTVARDRDLAPPLHLAEAALERAHVGRVGVLVLLVIDHAAGPLGVLVLGGAGVQPELGLHGLAGDLLQSPAEVALQRPSVLRIHGTLQQVVDVLDARGRLILAVGDQIHVVAGHAVQRRDEVERQEVNKAVLSGTAGDIIPDDMKEDVVLLPRLPEEHARDDGKLKRLPGQKLEREILLQAEASFDSFRVHINVLAFQHRDDVVFQQQFLILAMRQVVALDQIDPLVDVLLIARHIRRLRSHCPPRFPAAAARPASAG